jgi:outer membrane receptor protein involved in Fe transport
MFYMDSDESWDFDSVTDNYADSPAFATWSAYAAYDGVTIEPDASWWYSSQQTNRVDKAVFGELDYNLTDRLSLLVGGRWYEIDREIDYKVNRPTGYWGFDYQAAYPGQRQMVDDGFTPKVGLQYDVSDNVMIWSVYSEGYRVGGTNRGRGIPTLPLFYDSDLIENMEFGLKSNWMDDTVQLNATMYQMEWKDMQLEVTDPSFSIGQPWQAVVANLGDATVRGMDVSLTAVLSDNIQAGLNVTRIFNAYVNPIQTYPDDRFEGGVAPLGLEAKESLPMFAETSYSMYFEYTDQMDLFGTSGDGFVRLQHSYEGTSLNQLSDGSAAPQQEQGNYRLTDIVMGYDMGDWKAQVSLNNLSDERGITYRDSSDYDPFFGRNSDSVVRPRNYNVSLRRYF